MGEDLGSSVWGDIGSILIAAGTPAVLEVCDVSFITVMPLGGGALSDGAARNGRSTRFDPWSGLVIRPS